MVLQGVPNYCSITKDERMNTCINKKINKCFCFFKLTKVQLKSGLVFNCSQNAVLNMLHEVKCLIMAKMYANI